MKNFRVGENRGITLVVLVITIVVMLIITTTIISLSTNNLKTKHLSNMYTDIKSLDDKVAVFYNQYGTLPLKEKFTGSMQFQTAANPNDDLDGYYVIDVNKLNNLVLTKKLTWQNDDVYIINKKTHTIYYPHGVTLDGETYYRLPGEYSIIKEPTEHISAGITTNSSPSNGEYYIPGEKIEYIVTVVNDGETSCENIYIISKKANYNYCIGNLKVGENKEIKFVYTVSDSDANLGAVIIDVDVKYKNNIISGGEYEEPAGK